MRCFCEDLRLEAAVSVGEDSDVRRETAVSLHVSQCDEAVEPRICGFLDGLFESVCGDSAYECLKLPAFCR